MFISDNELSWEETGPGVRRAIIAFDPQVMMVKVAFEKGAVGPVHQHVHTQVSHVESGVFEIEISGSRKVLRTGDAFYVPSDELHGAVCLEAGVLLDVFQPMRADFLP